jgi:F-type H+-transporting ATPase subunit b
MPQLDPSTFSPQLFWLVVTFIVLLLLMWRVALPSIAAVLDEREKRIRQDLTRAEKLKVEADEAQAGWQKALATARARARDDMREAANAFAAESAKRDAAFAEGLTERTREVERNIAAAKARALADLPAVAADLAGAAVGKIAGLDVSDASRRAAVSAVASEGA